MRKMNARAAIPMPIPIFFGVETSFPLLERKLKIAMITGVRTMTKNGLIACHTSGATAEESTKSRAKNESDIPFWWNENQKKITIPRTAKSAYILFLISFAMAAFSSAVYSTPLTASFFDGVGKVFWENRKMTRDITIATTDAMNE